MSSKKSKDKVIWKPEWYSSEEKLPMEGSIVVSWQGEGDTPNENDTVLNSWISSEGGFLIKLNKPGTIWWRVYTQKDHLKKMNECEGYILQQYIDGKLKGLNLEKTFNIKPKQ